MQKCFCLCDSSFRKIKNKLIRSNKFQYAFSESYLFIELLPVTSGSGEAFSDDTRQSSKIIKMN